MSELLQNMKRAREADDLAPVLEAIPYARFLGLGMKIEGGVQEVAALGMLWEYFGSTLGVLLNNICNF